MSNPTSQRPRSVTIFTTLVLLLGSGINLARAFLAWRQAGTLADLTVSTSMPMWWLAATSLLWAFAFGVCGFGLWRLQSWARWGTLVTVTFYEVNVWFNHLVFDRSDYARQVLPASVVQTLLVLAIVWGYLNWPSIRRLFIERNNTTVTGENE